MKRYVVIQIVGGVCIAIVCIVGGLWAIDYMIEKETVVVRETDVQGYALPVQRAYEEINKAYGPSEQSDETKEVFQEDVDLSTVEQAASSVCPSLVVPRCDRNVESLAISSIGELGCVASLECIPLIYPESTCDYSDSAYIAGEVCEAGEVGVSATGRDGCFLPGFCVRGVYANY